MLMLWTTLESNQSPLLRKTNSKTGAAYHLDTCCPKNRLSSRTVWETSFTLRSDLSITIKNSVCWFKMCVRYLLRLKTLLSYNQIWNLYAHCGKIIPYRLWMVIFSHITAVLQYLYCITFPFAVLTVTALDSINLTCRNKIFKFFHWIWLRLI